MSEGTETPIFGQPPERNRTKHVKFPIKGQKGLGLEKQLPQPEPAPLSKALARRNLLKKISRMEATKREWDVLILNEGTRDEIRNVGRYYELAADVTPLGLFNIPPRTGRAQRLSSLTGGETVFVVKDSEKSTDRLRKGWAELMVLEKRQEDQKPQIRIYHDKFGVPIVTCRALFSGIIERQVLK